MNLYRLDPPAWNDGLGNRLALTRQRALARAASTGRPVEVHRIDGRTLRVSVALVCHPDGRVTR